MDFAVWIGTVYGEVKREYTHSRVMIYQAEDLDNKKSTHKSGWNFLVTRRENMPIAEAIGDKLPFCYGSIFEGIPAT